MSLVGVRSTPSAARGCADSLRSAVVGEIARLIKQRSRSRWRAASGNPTRPRRRCKLFLTQDRCVKRRERELAQSSITGVASNVSARNVTPAVASTSAAVSFVTGRIAAGKRPGRGAPDQEDPGRVPPRAGEARRHALRSASGCADACAEHPLRFGSAAVRWSTKAPQVVRLPAFGDRRD